MQEGFSKDFIRVPANTPDDWLPERQRCDGLAMLNVHAISHAFKDRNLGTY